MQDKILFEKIGEVLKKTRREPSKLMELIICIHDLNQKGKVATCSKVIRKLWYEEWKQAENKVAFENLKWDLLRKRRREINERIFNSDLCFSFFIELTQNKQFHIILDPKEIYIRRAKKLEYLYPSSKPKPPKEKIDVPIIGFKKKDKDFEKKRISVLPEDQPPDSGVINKPSIAILPFTNMSNDPKQEYFSDGITEEIITALSKLPKLFVVASNLSSIYKGKPLKIQQVGQKLGVQYILEGSFRKVDDKVRITAQLVDAISGNHLWAERYERDLNDIFALQDEITIKIITELQVELTEGEVAHLFEKGTDNIEAYLKAMQSLKYRDNMNTDDNLRAQRIAKEVIALDPNYATGYAHLAASYYQGAILGIYSYQKAAEMAFEQLQKALAIDENNVFIYEQLAKVHLSRRHYEKAIAICKQCIALNHNDSFSYRTLGSTLIIAGMHEEAISYLEKAKSLNPFDPMPIAFLGSAQLQLGNYEEAIPFLEETVRLRPEAIIDHLFLSCCYVATGKEEKALKAIMRVNKIDPEFTLEKISKGLEIYKDRAATKRILGLLRKAGMK